MKKLIVILLAGLLAACCMFGGCKRKFSNDDNSLEIYVANFGYGYEWIYDLLEDFGSQPEIQQKYPNFKYNVSSNTSRTQALDKILQGETNTVDLFFSITTAADKYESTYSGGKPYFEDLTELYKTKVPGEEVTLAEKLDDNFLKMSTFTRLDGSTGYYAVPWVAGMQGMLYNKSAFERLGLEVPNTTDELVKLCQQIVDKGETPFIFSSKENYWTCMMFLLWWAQYEGAENYANFYQGIVEENGKAVMSRDVFRQTGRLRSLEVIESLIYYPTDFIHDNVNTLVFTQAQAKFLIGEGLMMPNGDWFETEMSKTKEEDNVTDVFTFMKTPVISSITEKLVDSDMKDETLSTIIDAIDAGASKYSELPESVAALVCEEDFAKIYESRKLVLPVGNHNAFVPAYATAKELAKDFLLYLATDKANNLFIKATNGASLPFKYNVEEKDPELYASLPDIQKDRLDMQSDAIYMMNENTYAAVYYGGISRFTGDRTSVENLMTVKNADYQKNAQQIFDDEIEYWTADRWDSVLENMGLLK